MSVAPARPCPHPRCAQLVRGGGLCSVHAQQSAARRQYPASWAPFSRAWLREHPWCGDRDDDSVESNASRCRAAARQTRATQVDHVVAIGGDVAKLFDRKNLQSLCASCHARKTSTTDGGYGR